MTSRTSRRLSRSPGMLVLYVLLAALGLLYVLPFVVQLVTSLKTDPDAAAHPLSLLPDPFSLDSYRRLFGIGDAGDRCPSRAGSPTRCS
ncbi:hypothetical protein [Streptomyces sp. DfronAA-171]|uniref:hypothetical protein n=1 Tax=Streptomyces sp. DfronAA-171 TaxID=1839777 RepID=UPI00081F20E8|nr:hypothetical protein [Streptomyces sp. DfronAA-171]SCE12134.1 multiple sugar transport system permease protein [Streptomyces sp. DfronAA-171]